MLAFIDTRHAQPVDYAKAMSFIADHGHRAYLTKDGLLALSDCVWCDHERLGDSAPLADIMDRVFEEPAVFEVDDMGRVDGRKVRDWLGY